LAKFRKNIKEKKNLQQPPQTEDIPKMVVGDPQEIFYFIAKKLEVLFEETIKSLTP
jgi:hypothetical protein